MHGSSTSSRSSSITRDGSISACCCLSCTAYDESAGPSSTARSSTWQKLARHIGQLLARSTQGFRHSSCKLWPQGRRCAIISDASSVSTLDEEVSHYFHEMRRPSLRKRCVKQKREASPSCQSRPRCASKCCAAARLYKPLNGIGRHGAAHKSGRKNQDEWVP